MHVYKILRDAEWHLFDRQGWTTGSPDDVADGFIHLSTREQLQGTLARHFATERDLWILECSAVQMGKSLRWEPARKGDLFPHLFRPLERGDVLTVHRLDDEKIAPLLRENENGT
ncbi:MAG: DUF952 domain-containing protein [Paracoccus sp. (in: a-proteobacteria)]|nr:DUF952 domain-containing protein [Paracoccus sp. (in: a-proteobacteria)]